MFFEGRTFPAAAQALCAHLNRLLNTTLTRSRMGYVIRPASPGIADLHLPTGLVTIEVIVRFCIVDLGVKPLSSDWDALLRRSVEPR